MESKGKKPIWTSLRPLLHLWPGVLTLVLVLVTLPLTEPVLAQIPERLEAPVQEEALPEEEVEAEETPAPLAAEVVEGSYPDGVYTGSAQGYGGLITAQVTVEGGSITDVEIISAEGETTSFFNRAMGVIESVLTRQTWEVDVISGATYSSKGILGAIQNALTGEQVETPKPAKGSEPAPLVKESFTEPAGYVDGTYYGSATGFGGKIQVEVVIAEGKISSVQVVSAPGETSSYLNRAKAVLGQIVAANSPNVDTVSGATYSSNGILNAVKSALRQAVSDGETPEDLAQEEPNQPDSPIVIPPDVMPEEAYLDGVYTGTGEGFGGDVTVQVTISGGQLTEVQIVSAEEETPAYLEQAKGVIPAVLTQQNTQVDVVSGATYSSQGILEGIQNALAQALPPAETDPSAKPEETEPPEEPEEPNESETPQEPEKSDPSEEPAALYQDGIYSATVWCTDDDLFCYEVQVSITVTEGKITKIQVEKGEDTSEYPEDNDSYLENAINGRSRGGVWYPGLVEQIIAAQSADQVDVVSRATYSSHAIQKAAQQALTQAVPVQEGSSEQEECP